MSTMYVLAIATYEPNKNDDTVTIVFPDFPGAGTSGNGIQEALSRAEENISAHLAGRLEAGLPIPEMRDLRDEAEVRSSGDFAEELAGPHTITYVRAALPSNAVRVNLTIDAGLLSQIDRAAATDSETRSAFMSAAAREYMHRRPAQRMVEKLIAEDKFKT